jgi:branched-subunit amino acid ABC-type transport system permease component
MVKIRRGTFLATLALAAAITAANIAAYGGGPSIVESSLQGYGGAGFSFQGPEGMRFNFSRLGDEGLSYMEGYWFRFLYDNETDLPYIAVSWMEAAPLNITEAVTRSYNYTDTRRTRYSIGDVMNKTIHGHPFLHASVVRQVDDVSRFGYVGYWNCTNSGRVMTLIVDSPSQGNETYVDWLFNQTVTSFSCHYPGQTPYEELDMPFDVDKLISSSIMIIFCVGFTLTYMLEGFPNFAHTSYASIGAMVSFFLTRAFGFNPYDTWPFTAVVGGLIGVALYVFIVRPIRRHGGYQEITLTLTFFIIAYVMPSIASIFNYWSWFSLEISARGYNLRWWDFGYRGVPGIAIISTATCVLLIIGLHLFLNNSKLGLSLRATSENEGLSAVLGVNIFRAHCASWFISGALSALAGSILAVRGGMGVGGDGLIVSVMSGAIFGGVQSVWGAVAGGLFVALSQDALADLFFALFGLPAMKWQGLLPLAFLVLTLTLFPNGVFGDEGLRAEAVRERLRELRSRLRL